MSFLGSPYEYIHDDYEFDNDQFFDEFDNRENDDPKDETDEDTEDASETDTGRRDEPLEMKEQIYQVQLSALKKKLQQLKDGNHHEYNRRCKRLEIQFQERLRLNEIYREYMIDCAEKDYINEKKAAVKEFEDKKIDLRENLLSDFEDKRKNIESERYTMELTGDSMEVKPVMTRKLRRRPNDPVPVPEKRRKAPSAQIIYVLDDKDIEHDLKSINKGGKFLTPIRKTEANHEAPNPLSSSNPSPSLLPQPTLSSLPISSPHQQYHLSSISNQVQPMSSNSTPSITASAAQLMALSSSSGSSSTSTAAGLGAASLLAAAAAVGAASGGGIMAGLGQALGGPLDGSDMVVVASGIAGGPTVQHPFQHTQQLQQQQQQQPQQQPQQQQPQVETRVEDGKLSYERRWFHRGQSVYVEGRDMLKFPASISAITADVIWVKKATDGSKVKICVNSLARGKVLIKRRAS